MVARMSDRKSDRWPLFLAKCREAGSAEISLQSLQRYPRWVQEEVLIPRLHSLILDARSGEHLIERFLRPSVRRLEFKVVEGPDRTVEGIDGHAMAATLATLAPDLVHIRGLSVRCLDNGLLPGLPDVGVLWPFFEEIAGRKELNAFGVSNVTITTTILGLIARLPYLVELRLDGRRILDDNREGSIANVHDTLEQATSVDLSTLILHTGYGRFHLEVLTRFQHLRTLEIRIGTHVSKASFARLAWLTMLERVIVRVPDIDDILDGDVFKGFLSSWHEAEVIVLDHLVDGRRPWTTPALKLTDLNDVGRTNPRLSSLRVSLTTRLEPHERGPSVPLRLGTSLDLAWSALDLRHTIRVENYLAKLGIAHGRLMADHSAGCGWHLLTSPMLFGQQYGCSLRWWAGPPELEYESGDSYSEDDDI